MKKSTFITMLSAALLVSCNTGAYKQNTDSGEADVFSKIYSADNLKTQLFNINNNVDNTVVGKSGTTLFIPKNCFTDSLGKAVSGNIEIELKEALRPEDWVMGNLATVFDGKPLESGGMVYLDAKSLGKKLVIAPGKSVAVEVPAENFLKNMSLFKGTPTGNGVKWSDPVALPGQKKQEAENQFEILKRERATNVRYSVDGLENGEDAPQEVQDEIGRICWSGNGLKITKDSTLQIDGYTVHFYKRTDLKDVEETMIQKGWNSFAEDSQTSYIFSMKKLGWANIDRLNEDPRTEEVNLVTSVTNRNDFKFVFISLITQNMYLPGYQKKDGNFGFSHNDDEAQMLPVGETATILATAYKDGQPYFALHKIKIKKDQQVALNLRKTTKSDLQEKLVKSL